MKVFEIFESVLALHIRLWEHGVSGEIEILGYNEEVISQKGSPTSEPFVKVEYLFNQEPHTWYFYGSIYELLRELGEVQ